MIRALLSGGIFMLAIGAAQAAGDVAAGKAKAATCDSCHGANGQGNERVPALAGESEHQLVELLRRYRNAKSFERHEADTRLTDQDIMDLAAYYSSMKAPSKQK
jgi:cytochrome c553